MKEPSRVLLFCHGKESGPAGIKIQTLAEVAEARGYQVFSPDFRSTSNPDERVRMLLEDSPPPGERLLLAGSSMGGYVATVASSRLHPRGLFLMAPAFYLSGYSEQEPHPVAACATVVHGWKDEVVPADHVIRFCRRYDIPLHLLDAGHTLVEQLPMLRGLFQLFLDRLEADTVTAP